MRSTWLRATILLVVAFAGADLAAACSRVLWNDNGVAVVVGRDMGWIEDMRTNLWAFPRGIVHSGLAGANSITWISKYGSVVAGAYDVAAVDGVNEKGLVANMLWLTGTDYGRRDPAVPGLSMSLWAQYVLDNYSTVAEAVAATERREFQVVPASFRVAGTDLIGSVHLSLADASGDSAIIEIVKDGTPIIHHDRSYTVMTNEPLFSEQLKNLQGYAGFGGSAPLPGTSEPTDRFVRAAYYLKQMQPPHDTRETIASTLSIVRNVSALPVKAGAGEPIGLLENPYSVWHTVADATHRTYFFESTSRPQIVWVALGDLDLNEGSPARKLDLVASGDLVGDVSASFKPSAPMAFQKGVAEMKSATSVELGWRPTTGTADTPPAP